MKQGYQHIFIGAAHLDIVAGIQPRSSVPHTNNIYFILGNFEIEKCLLYLCWNVNFYICINERKLFWIVCFACDSESFAFISYRTQKVHLHHREHQMAKVRSNMDTVD